MGDPGFGDIERAHESMRRAEVRVNLGKLLMAASSEDLGANARLVAGHFGFAHPLAWSKAWSRLQRYNFTCFWSGTSKLVSEGLQERSPSEKPLNNPFMSSAVDSRREINWES